MIIITSYNHYDVHCYSNKSKTCDWATLFLNENGIKAVNLHGDMPYEIRLGKFKQYQDGEVNIMVSTDVGSRGLNTIRVNISKVNHTAYVYIILTM